MKSQERHKLKENQLVRGVEQARHTLEKRRRDITWAVVLILALLASVGRFTAWRASRSDRATEPLRRALAT